MCHRQIFVVNAKTFTKSPKMTILTKPYFLRPQFFSRNVVVPPTTYAWLNTPTMIVYYLGSLKANIWAA